MKLTHVSIHNFRGILDQEFDVGGYTLLVGSNNSGKSTVIDCIRAFYEKDGAKYGPTDDPYIGADDRASWIELTFKLSDDEHETLAPEYQTTEKSLRVRKLFRADEHEERKAGFIYAYRSKGDLAQNSFYGAKNVQSGKFGTIHYVPAISKVEEHAKLTGPSALRDILVDVMANVAGDSDAYRKLTANVEDFSTSVQRETTPDGRSLDRLQAEITEMMAPWRSRFGIEFQTPSINDVIRHMFNSHFVDDVYDEPQTIDQYGSGFQRYFIYVLVRVASSYVLKAPNTTATVFTPAMTLLLFEEPEAFLHPQLQDVLAQSLNELASDGRWQVMCATHSSQFVSRSTDHIPSIVRLSQHGGEVTARQVTQQTWERLVNDNQELNRRVGEAHDDDQTAEMEAIKYFLWLNPDRSSVFFARHVLLVEGATEVALINRLIGSGEIRGDTAGLYVLDCMGKYNIHRFMNLLELLGVPHAVIHDDDSHNDREDHRVINDLIHEAKNSFTVAIEAIAGNLERMLKITDVGRPHRKPQHALYRYETSAIEPGKLRQFCDLVERCLPPSQANGQPGAD